MEARAIQRTVRQSARKMRLVSDQIRGRAVPEAYAILRFSKKHAAKQIQGPEIRGGERGAAGARTTYRLTSTAAGALCGGERGPTSGSRPRRWGAPRRS
jgi:ribosomal protein L22